MDWMTKTDRELISACGQGSNDLAFAELVRRYRGMVHGTCRRITGSEHDADDLTQVVFALLADRAASLGTHTSPAGWLCKTAWHVSVKLRREQQRRRRHEDTLAASRPDLHLPDTDAFELPVELADALAELAEPSRDMIVLYHFVGLTLQQIAEMTNEPVGTVSGRLSRARMMLRSRLSSRGVTPETIVVLFNGMELGSPPMPDALPVETAVVTTPKSAAALAAASSGPLAVIAKFHGIPPVPVFNASKALCIASPVATGSGFGAAVLAYCSFRVAVLAAIFATGSIAAIGTAYQLSSARALSQASSSDSGTTGNSKLAAAVAVADDDEKVSDDADADVSFGWSSSGNDNVPEPGTAAIAGGAIALLGLRRPRRRR